MVKGLLFSLLWFALICVTVAQQVTVDTYVGSIIGERIEGTFNGSSYYVTRFLGIPYAESTEGYGRFMRPTRKADFDVPFNASTPGHRCPQRVQNGIDMGFSEDCLNLNIFVPDGAIGGTEPKAVMVWIYGGAFQVGSQDTYMTSALSGLNDVIYVTMNYRVSAFGFLGSKKYSYYGMDGNNGLWDQHAAIKWVNDNIDAFGGDLDRVTIFGESAGAASVIYQANYDGNWGLFQRAIAESGSVGPNWSYSSHPDKQFDDFLERLGCNDKAEDMYKISCLQSLPLSVILENIGTTDIFKPVQDDDFIRFDPGQMLHDDRMSTSMFGGLDILMGQNTNEGGMTLMEIASLNQLTIDDIKDGMSESQFAEYMNELFMVHNIEASDALIASLRHQYTDWNNPDDPTTLRSAVLHYAMDADYTTAITQRLKSHAHSGGYGNTYMYVFDHRPSYSTAPEWLQGANHGDEIGYVLGFPGTYGDVAPYLPAQDVQLALDVMKYWTNFAKTGDPNVKDGSLTFWPVYEPEDATYIHLAAGKAEYQTREHFRREQVSYWTHVVPAIREMSGHTEFSDWAPCYCVIEKSIFAELEIKAMRDNLVFYGVPEVQPGMQENCSISIHGVISTYLDIPDEFKLDAAYRPARRGQGNAAKPRPHIARFHNGQDRERVRSASLDPTIKQTLKDGNIGIGPQLPKDVRDARKPLYDAMRAAKDAGKEVKFVGKTLYINGRPYAPQPEGDR
ncbi:acetylcholinesterase-like [Mya arenaria]|uniref:acetylcholinesterase-like n=1 Tax=Mya arenaria TaxID=6604 RepID=UPI0022E7EDF6|nr:acetylcholinesterase-like [Mya arenaria]